MPREDPKALVRRYLEEVWNQAAPGALERLTSEDFRYTLAGQPARERAGMLAFLSLVHTAFPDWRVEVEELFGEGDRVAVRWQGEVTHLGEFRGIAPTGKRILVRGINLYSIRDGRITEEWEQMDSLGMLQQLGALPRP